MLQKLKTARIAVYEPLALIMPLVDFSFFFHAILKIMRLTIQNYCQQIFLKIQKIEFLVNNFIERYKSELMGFRTLNRLSSKLGLLF